MLQDFASLIAASSVDIREKLAQSGWSPARQVEVTGYIQGLGVDGYVVFPVVREFLAKFGGIQVQWSFVRSITGNIIHSGILFEPVEAANSIDPAWVQDCTKLIRGLC